MAVDMQIAKPVHFPYDFVSIFGYMYIVAASTAGSYSPATVKAAGGLVRRDPDGTGSVIDHCYNRLGDKDPWVSTTNDKKVAAGGAKSPGDVYVHYINPSCLTFKSAEREFAKAKEETLILGRRNFQ
ncbi:hypothetical protein VPNG_03974 [Cytospora leucostoma]|uniref:Uncharacterized protein n=1 Tax=Cytospora leucostoma TaxID=1230097 RepID=A0A423XEG4_9PEZI|nr:hypothetical protein VPNG_03974 [Cytospora leucostoma]